MSNDETIEAGFAAHVWMELSNIDVGDYTKTKEVGKKGERKRTITYIPWHRAWMLVKRAFPGTTWRDCGITHHADGTAEITVSVHITNSTHPYGCDPSHVVVSTATLPVMGFGFSAITNPDARDISDSRQRAIVKALAFAGLGLNLWADDWRPVGTLSEPITNSQCQQLEALLRETETNVEAFLEWAGVDGVEDLPAEKFPRARSFLEAKIGEQS